MDDIFFRELEIEHVDKTTTLRFRQKLEGDVNCVVWDGAIVLAKFLEKQCLENHGFLENRSVIELGSGVGCVGIVAACLGANVLLTDLPQALPLLRQNVEENKTKLNGCVEVEQLNWGTPCKINFTPDIILLAECIYYKEVIGSLVSTLRQLATHNTKVILCQELRDSQNQKECWKEFLESVQEYFEVGFVPQSEQSSEYSCPEIQILRLIKK
nr:unnamed protein product [Callosobruchus analis]